MLNLKLFLLLTTVAALAVGEVIYKVTLGEIKFTWEQAKEKCDEDGGILASPKNTVENQALMNAMNASGDKGPFWFGVTKIGNNWTWSDGTPLTWTNWWRNWPPSDDDTCALVWRKGHWSSYSDGCQPHEKYVCQYISPSLGTSVSACNGDQNLANGTIIAGLSVDTMLVEVQWASGETGHYKYAEKCGK